MSTARNTLIALLPRVEGKQLEALCKPVQLHVGQMLQTTGQSSGYVYFPTGALVCLFATVGGDPVIELGMVGREGPVGAEIALGARTAPFAAVVQEAGYALRIEAAVFQGEFGRSAALQAAVNRHIDVTMRQIATSVGCVRSHQLAPRLARWLLVTQDHAGADDFLVTQQFLAQVLGVRRVGITAAAQEMHRTGLIDYRRGRITVADRHGLHRAACSCYDTDRQLYRSLMKPIAVLPGEGKLPPP